MTRMPVARTVLVALALIVLTVILWKTAPVWILVFAGIVIASMIRAASEPLARRSGMSPHLSVGVVLFVALGLLATGAWFFGLQIAAQADALWQALQVAWKQAQTFLARFAIGRMLVENVQDGPSAEAISHVAKGTVSVFGGLADVGLVLFLALYFALDPETYRRGLVRLLPLAARAPADRALAAAGVDLRKWVVGQLGAMLTVGIAIGAGLLLIGAPLAIPLGVLSALLEFVPIIGPIAATVVGVLIAFADSPAMALHAGIVYVVVLFLEGNVIIPLAQKWAVALPPALGLVGIAIAGVLFGLPGVLFAMPLLVVAVRLVRSLHVERLEAAATPAP